MPFGAYKLGENINASYFQLSEMLFLTRALQVLVDSRLHNVAL